MYQTLALRLHLKPWLTAWIGFSLAGLAYAAEPVNPPVTPVIPEPTLATAALVQQVETLFKQAQTEMNNAPVYKARALLQPWWDLLELPVELQLLRALIRQKLADYPAARADFQKILQSEPQQAQAHASLALLQRYQGDYTQARVHCLALQRLQYQSLATLCLSNLLGREGHGQQAYKLLEAAIFDSQGDGPAAYQAIALELAMLDQRLGQLDLAQHNFDRAFSTQRQDLTLLVRYADFLLEQQQAAAVLDKLPTETTEPRLLLRRALACQALTQTACVNTLSTHLTAAYTAALAQGDHSLLDEEARFLLQIKHEAEPALRQLTQLWTQRKEPEIARWSLEAALACADPDSVRPVLDWITQHGWEDVILHKLIARLNALPAPQANIQPHSN